MNRHRRLHRQQPLLVVIRRLSKRTQNLRQFVHRQRHNGALRAVEVGLDGERLSRERNGLFPCTLRLRARLKPSRLSVSGEFDSMRMRIKQVGE